MAAKRSQPVDKEKLVEDLHHAVRAFVEGNGGKLSVIGPSRSFRTSRWSSISSSIALGTDRSGKSLKAHSDLTNHAQREGASASCRDGRELSECDERCVICGHACAGHVPASGWCVSRLRLRLRPDG